jgi:hypothetical protein
VNLDQDLEGVVLDSVGSIDGGAGFRGRFLRITLGHDRQGHLLGSLFSGALDRKTLPTRNVLA